jgi:hypothetical protein
MTLYDFVQLNAVEKVNAVWEGRFLSCKENKDQTVVLYKVHNFFCQVYYNNNDNSIVTLKPFRTQELLHEFFAYQLN